MKIIFDSEEQQQRWFDSIMCPSYLGLKEIECGTGCLYCEKDCDSSNLDCKTCWEQSGLEMEVKSENDISDKVCCKCKYDYVDSCAWPCSSCEMYSEFEPKNKEEV